MGKEAWSILPLFVYEPLSAKQVKMAEFVHQGRAQYKNILAIFIFLARLFVSLQRLQKSLAQMLHKIFVEIHF